MKKITRHRLALKKETVRALDDQELERAQGGISAYDCNTKLDCPTGTCPTGLCSNISRLPGC